MQKNAGELALAKPDEPLFTADEVWAVHNYAAWDGGNVNRPTQETEALRNAVIGRLMEHHRTLQERRSSVSSDSQPANA